jgi:hypothetical protein
LRGARRLGVHGGVDVLGTRPRPGGVRRRLYAGSASAFVSVTATNGTGL